MNVGSLFISLGVKGSEKAIGALGAVKDGLTSIIPKSLEAKAGIIGAVYALEQFLSHGADRATTLENMSATLGVTVDRLQLLGNAALASRTPLETVVQTLQSAQLALARLNTTGETQPWMARFIQLSGAFKLGPNPFMYLQQHIEELPKFIQAYADVEKDVGTRNLVLQSLGMSGLTAAVARGNFRPEEMARAAKMPSLSVGETSQLDAVRTQLAKINQEIEIGLSKVAARFGPKMMGDVQGVVTQVMHLVGAFAELADKVRLVQGVGTIFQGWSEIFKGLNALTDAFMDPKKMEALKKGFVEIMGFIKDQLPSIALPPGASDVMKFIGDMYDKSKAALPGAIETVKSVGGGLIESAKSTSLAPGSLLPGVPLPTGSGAIVPRSATQAAPPPGGNTTSQNVNVNQNFKFDDTKDKQGVANAAAAGVKSAYRQNPALLRYS